MTSVEKISFIIKLPLEQKFWLLAFWIGSLVALIVIHWMPNYLVSIVLGHHVDNRQLSMLATKNQVMTARRMARRMDNVANNVPWKCLCLSQCMCLMWMFKLYKIPAVTYLGARITDEIPRMKAHAWVKVGRNFVSGGDGSRDYQITATFTSSRLC